MKLQDLVTAIDSSAANLSSAIRLFVLDFYRSRASDIEAEANLQEMLLRPDLMMPLAFKPVPQVLTFRSSRNGARFLRVGPR
jgi:hypothetical protein